jgi:hypothetical protein
VSPITPIKQKRQDTEEYADKSTLSPESKKLNKRIKNLKVQMELKRQLKKLEEELVGDQ